MLKYFGLYISHFSLANSAIGVAKIIASKIKDNVSLKENEFDIKDTSVFEEVINQTYNDNFKLKVNVILNIN